MSRDAKIEAFVDSLASAEMLDDRSGNIYRNETRRDNLKRWLITFEDTSQSAIFVGEAPGVNGARITGIPFVSPAVITGGADCWGMFGADSGYRVPEGANAGQSESTATIFRDVVGRCMCDLPRPLTWNAYPYWPHDSEGLRNRTPTRLELEEGMSALRQVIAMFPRSRVVAVGRKAESALAAIDVQCDYVRHPANGGKSGFEEGVRRVAEETFAKPSPLMSKGELKGA